MAAMAADPCDLLHDVPDCVLAGGKGLPKKCRVHQPGDDDNSAGCNCANAIRVDFDVDLDGNGDVEMDDEL